MVHLFLLAHEVSSHDRFFNIAERAAWDVWDSQAPTGFDLCCGLAGRAYALLKIYRHTGEAGWLKKAVRLAERAVAMVNTRPAGTYRNGLYRGDLGVVVLLSDLERPEEASMPLFGPEDWLSGQGA